MKYSPQTEEKNNTQINKFNIKLNQQTMHKSIVNHLFYQWHKPFFFENINRIYQKLKSETTLYSRKINYN